jgi:hypothetical protein
MRVVLDANVVIAAAASRGLAPLQPPGSRPVLRVGETRARCHLPPAGSRRAQARGPLSRACGPRDLVHEPKPERGGQAFDRVGRKFGLSLTKPVEKMNIDPDEAG